MDSIRKKETPRNKKEFKSERLRDEFEGKSFVLRLFFIFVRGGLEMKCASCGRETPQYIEKLFLHIPRTSWSHTVENDEHVPCCSDCVQRVKEWAKSSFFPAPMKVNVQINAVVKKYEKKEVVSK